MFRKLALIALSATGVMAAWLKQRLDNPLLIGPDEESVQWVAAIAKRDHLDYCVARKERLGDRNVRVTLPDGNYTGRQIILVDDVASTGRTLEMAARELLPHKPASIAALVTHALFFGDALQRLQQAGVKEIWSCDTIPHPTNRLQLAELLAGVLTRQING